MVTKKNCRFFIWNSKKNIKNIKNFLSNEWYWKKVHIVLRIKIKEFAILSISFNDRYKSLEEEINTNTYLNQKLFKNQFDLDIYNYP